MGCVTSCFRVEDYEDYTNPSSTSIIRNCPCPRCLVNSLLNLYITLFRRNETRSLPSSLQATTTVSITSSSSYDNFMSNTFQSTPRPLPYDADPGYFRSRRDSSLVSRRDKGSSHSHEEAEPLRSDADESFSVEGSKWATSKLMVSTGEDSKEDFGKSTRRYLKSKAMMDAGGNNDGVYIMSDDEDVCPTCLEEYTSENPKIVTKCSHHFHLGCIYEWMERSENCPVCGKVMEFNETP